MKKLIDRISEAFEKYNLIFLGAVIAIYLVSRYVYLGEICYYMDIDELGSAIDSVKIANGSENIMQHPSVLVIAAAMIFKVKGGLFSLKLYRLISVAGGLVSLIFSYLTVKEMTGQKKYALLEALLCATLPIYFISSRTGVSAYMTLWLAPAAFFFLIKAMNSKKRPYYAVSALFFIAVILTILGEDHKMGFSNIPTNILNIKSLVWDDSHPFNISSTFGTIYSFSVPVLIAGIIISVKKTAASIKNRTVDANVVLWIYTLVMLFTSLLTKDADTRSACGLFFAASLFICEGLIWLCENIKGVIIIELAVYLICLKVFAGYYFENFNSEVNNSSDHEAGIVVDKSVGEAVKASLNLFADKQIAVISEDFEGRDLMIDLFGNSNVRIGKDEDPAIDGSTVYVINQTEHQDIIDYLTSQGWGNLYLKEYTVCYMQ